MTVPGLIVIQKVRVEKLLSPGPGGWGLRQFKVKFRAGSAAGETTAKQPNPDGSIEWPEPLTMSVYDTEKSLIASVVTRSGRNHNWSLVPGGRFEGFPVKVLPAVWSHVAGTGTSFCAELEIYIDGAEGGSAEPPRSSMDSVEEHEGRQYFPAFAAGDAHAGLPQHMQRRRLQAEDSIYPGAGGGPPGWAPAAAASPFARTQPGELPVSTAVSVAAELVPDEAVGAAAAAVHASAAPRGGSMYTTPSARRHSSLIARSWSGGFLTRDGNIPGRSREGSLSSFQLARGSSRSLGESLAGSSSQDDSAPPALPSPVGAPTVSRLMDDNFRLEENEDEDSQAFSAAAGPSVPAWGELASQIPSVPAWGEQALQLASAPAALPGWRACGAGRSGPAVQAGWTDEVTTVTLTTTTGVAPSVRPCWLDGAQSTDAGRPERFGGIDDTRSAQREEQEEANIRFSPAYSAGDSPAHRGRQVDSRKKTQQFKSGKKTQQFESRKKKGSGPFSFLSRITRRPPDVSSALPESDSDGRVIALSMEAPASHEPPSTLLGLGKQRGGPRPRRAGAAAGARGRGAGGPEDARGESNIPLQVEGYGAAYRGPHLRTTSGKLSMEAPASHEPPSRLRLGKQRGGPRSRRPPAMGAGAAAGARGRGAGGPEDARGESNIPLQVEGYGAAYRGPHHGMTSGRSQVSGDSQGSDDSQRPMSRRMSGQFMRFARQEAAAPASEEPVFAGSPSPREMMPQLTAPTAPPPPPPYEEEIHGYDPPWSMIGTVSPPPGAASPLPLQTFGAARQNMGRLPGTADAESPPPPSYNDLLASIPGYTPSRSPSRVHGTSSLGRAQHEEKKAKPAEATEEYPTYDHPAALGLGFAAGYAGKTAEQQMAMPASIAARSAADRPNAPQRSPTYPEGETPRDDFLPTLQRGDPLLGFSADSLPRHSATADRFPSQREAFLAGQRWLEAPALPGASVRQPLSARRAESAPGAIQPLERVAERGPAQPDREDLAEMAIESPSYDHPATLGSRYEDRDAGYDVEGYSAMPANGTLNGSNGSRGRTFYPDGRIPGDEEMLAVMRRLEAQEPRVVSVPRSLSVREVEPATRAIQPLPRVGEIQYLGRDQGRETVDPVCFSCFSPRSVWRGREFELNVMAYLPRSRDEVLQAAQTKGEVEAGLPGGMSIMRGRRVTVKLDLPAKIFEALGPEENGFNQVSHHPPTVRDFVWGGKGGGARFRVQCRPRADVGSVRCGAYIIEGSRVTSLSFFIEVVETEDECGYDDLKAELLDTKTEQVKANVAVIDPDELTISDTIIGHGVQGETFKGVYKGKPVAIKRLKQSSAPSSCVSEVYGLRHEATILSLLGHHPNIVEFHGLSKRGGGIGDEGLDVVTKYEEGGSLQEALGLGGNGDGRTNGGGRKAGNGCGAFSGSVRTAWARDMARGLANSHAAGVLHNDVASRNALRSSAAVGAPVLLCDFGMSRILRGDGVERASLIDVWGNREKWPLRQMPKESLEAPFPLSEASDAWMYGTMLYEIFEGKKPFCGTHTNEVKRLVLEGKTLDTPDLLKDQGLELEKVYRRCLQVDHTARPSMEEVVATLSF